MRELYVSQSRSAPSLNVGHAQEQLFELDRLEPVGARERILCPELARDIRERLKAVGADIRPINEKTNLRELYAEQFRLQYGTDIEPYYVGPTWTLDNVLNRVDPLAAHVTSRLIYEALEGHWIHNASSSVALRGDGPAVFFLATSKHGQFSMRAELDGPAEMSIQKSKLLLRSLGLEDNQQAQRAADSAVLLQVDLRGYKALIQRHNAPVFDLAEGVLLVPCPPPKRFVKPVANIVSLQVREDLSREEIENPNWLSPVDDELDCDFHEGDENY
jgi:hypothetical protein